jgi:hypothetical protein
MRCRNVGEKRCVVRRGNGLCPRVALRLHTHGIVERARGIIPILEKKMRDTEGMEVLVTELRARRALNGRRR